jgi:hypothetical protein
LYSPYRLAIGRCCRIMANPAEMLPTSVAGLINNARADPHK